MAGKPWNQPIGALATIRTAEKPLWSLGYYNGHIHFLTQQEASLTGASLYGPEVEIRRGWKQYWYHVVGTYDGMQLKLYVNGEAQGSPQVLKELPLPAGAQLEVAAYLENEPHMGLADLIKSVRLYDYALGQSQIADRFMQLQRRVEAGKIQPNRFHFNAGPYLHYVTRHSVNLTWETDRPASVVIEYGKQLPLTEKIVVPIPNGNPEVNESATKLIGEATISGLQPETSYFYHLKATSSTGETIESGILTFRTAVSDKSAFSFAFMGIQKPAHISIIR